MIAKGHREPLYPSARWRRVDGTYELTAPDKTVLAVLERGGGAWVCHIKMEPPGWARTREQEFWGASLNEVKGTAYRVAKHWEYVDEGWDFYA